MVEFALVIPILLILTVGLSDLGRVFAAGVVTESAARAAAEIAAQQYLRDYPSGPPNPVPLGYYAALDLPAAQAICAELKSVPNANFSVTEIPPAAVLCKVLRKVPKVPSASPGFR